MNKNKRETALDWYYHQTVVLGKKNHAELYEVAKNMLKNDIMNAHRTGFADAYGVLQKRTAEEYYEKIYGS